MATPNNQKQTEKKDKPDTDQSVKAHWSDRVKVDIEKATTFAQKYAVHLSPVIGKLYMASKATHTASVMLASFGVPGAAPVAAISMIANKSLKIMWDAVRDVKDATETMDGENPDSIEEASERIDEAAAKIQALERRLAKQKSEYAMERSEMLEVVRDQADALEGQRETNQHLSDALNQTQASLSQMQEQHMHLVGAVNNLMREREQASPETLREYNQIRYKVELDTAKKNAELIEVPYNPDTENVVRTTSLLPSSSCNTETNDQGQGLTEDEEVYSAPR